MNVTACIPDGKTMSAQIRAELKRETEAFTGRAGRRPGLATILVGDNPASHTYVANQIKACADTGMESIHRPLPAATCVADLLALIRKLNEEPKVDGILLQLPLPLNADLTPALELIDPGMDADGQHPLNLGQLFEYKNWTEMASGKTPLSCTPHGAIVLDVGINRDTEGRLCGDVDFDAVNDKISAITPVPGGVGPMTIAMLLHNALQLAKKRAYPPHP